MYKSIITAHNLFKVAIMLTKVKSSEIGSGGFSFNADWIVFIA